jgi:hypothetical protein
MAASRCAVTCGVLSRVGRSAKIIPRVFRVLAWLRDVLLFQLVPGLPDLPLGLS